MRRATKRLTNTLITCAVAGSVACAPDSVAPTERGASPRVANFSAAPSVSAVGRYVVTFAGGIPEDFASQVAALGGSVTFSHAGVGIAAVRGLSDAGAASLAASPGVATLNADAVVTLRDGTARATAAPTGFATRSLASPASPANPASAFFYGLGFQWNMQAIRADQAWAAGKLGSPDVTVAIIDSGIDYNSFDLAGLVDLSRSVSFSTSDDALVAAVFPGVHPSTDLNGHGTHVATQVTSNALAFAGITSRTRLIAVKVLGVNGRGLVSEGVAGILYAADQGADVANLSVLAYLDRSGNRSDNGILNRVVEYASKKGMLLVAGAGNDAIDIDHNGNTVLAWCDVVPICVSATGPLTPTSSPFDLAIYSNYGFSAISVAAPGGNYGGPVSDWPWGPFPASLVWALCSRTTLIVDADGNPIAAPYMSGLTACGNVGTSLATPHVTGLAALLVAEYGKIGSVRLKQLITTRAVDLGKPGRDQAYGWGHIDVPRALGF